MNTKPLIDQLATIVTDYEAMLTRAQHDDLSDLPEADRQALVTRSVASIHRISGTRSAYAEEVRRIFSVHVHLHQHTGPVVGVVKGLLADVKAGFMQSLVDLVHAETFADFLEMAEHLASTGYKDAAAVVAGSSLEAHLRTLCKKIGLPTEVTRADGSTVAKKADTLNSELTASSAYTLLDQKSITAWLDLRNKAAHGKYTEYASEQVSLMLSGVRDFITRTS